MAKTGITECFELDKRKKRIDFAKVLEFNDDFKISLDKSDIKLMTERVMHDGKVEKNNREG